MTMYDMMAFGPRYIFFFYLCLNFLLVSSTKGACPKTCSCRDYQINCYARLLQQVPKDIPTHAVQVDLQSNEIDTLDHADLQTLTSLEELKLRYNKITSIPPDTFQKLGKLKKLNLAFNQLHNLPTRAFSGASSLSELDLAGNKIDSVEDAFSNLPQLTRLDMSNNRLKKITRESFRPLQGLLYLILTSNQIKSIEPGSFSSLTRLVHLVLRGNPIDNVDGLFQHNIHLSSLDFSECHLKNIPTLLPQSVRYLQLGKNQITHLHRDVVADIPLLSILVLDDNKISAVDEAVFILNPHLQQLWLNDNLLTSIPQALPIGLTNLYMNKNFLTSITRENFPENSQLKRISLKMNNITTFEMDAFRHVASLDQLYLSSNQIQILKNLTFHHLSSLTLLSLGDNPIEQIEGAAFSGLEHLEKLELSAVPNTETEIQGDIFRHTPRLMSLDLRMSPAAARHVINSEVALNSLNTLQELNLQNNRLTFLPRQVRKSLLRLRKLQLDGNLWHCDQRLLPLHTWLLDQKDIFSNPRQVSCLAPPQLYGRAVAELNQEDFLQPETSTAFSPSNLIQETETSTTVTRRERTTRARNVTPKSTTKRTPKGKKGKKNQTDTTRKPTISSSVNTRTVADIHHTTDPLINFPTTEFSSISVTDNSIQTPPEGDRLENENDIIDDSVLSTNDSNLQPNLTKESALDDEEAERNETDDGDENRANSAPSEEWPGSNKMKVIVTVTAVSMVLIILALVVMLLLMRQNNTTKLVYHRARQYRPPGNDVVFYVGDQKAASPDPKPRLSRSRSDQGSVSSRPSEDITNDLDTSMKVYTWGDEK